MSRLRKWFTQSNIIIAVAVGCLVAVAIAFYGSNTAALTDKDDTIGIQRQRITTLLQQNGDLSEAIAQANGKLQANGLPTVAAPSPAQAGPAGSAGSAGRDGRGVAFALCTATGWAVTYTDGETENGGDCIGKTGPTGKTGTNGNDGSPGIPGATGTAGKDGVDGQPGANGADGATGAKGDTGATGPAGTGFTSVTCATSDDGSTVFRFTLTDGTTQDVAGTCAPPMPDPTETPAP